MSEQQKSERTYLFATVGSRTGRGGRQSTIKGQTGIVAFSRYWTRDGEKSDDASRGILIFGTERA